MTAPPLILAHRGLHANAPENTLLSFERARRAGCDGIELDVRTLADGTLVAHHDAYMGPRRRRPLSGLKRAALRAEKPRVPTLSRVVAWAKRWPRLLLDVELKERRTLEEGVLELMDERAKAPTVVTSFDATIVADVKRARPSLGTGLIGPAWTRPRRLAGVGQAAVDAGADVVVLHASTVRAPLVTGVRSYGLAVWCWGENQPTRARRMNEMGVVAFITDDPEALRAAWPRTGD